MPKIDENEIRRRLKLIAQIEPTSEATNRAIMLVRRTLKEEEKPHTSPHARIWRLIFRSPLTKFAAAAVIIFGVILATTIFDGTSAWAKIVRALAEVENVHVVAIHERPDGAVEREQYWVKRPHYLRVEYSNRIIIDDGSKRLDIDSERKTVQFSDSREPFEPVEQNEIFRMLGSFRNESLKDSPGVQAVKLSAASTERTLVYEISYHRSVKGKAWVDAETMLLRRLLMSDGGKQTVEVTFSYDPIPPEMFRPEPPPGYTELPYIEHLTLSGEVVSQQGETLPDVVVYATHSNVMHVLKDRTDHEGRFAIKLLPDKTGSVAFPVFLRAFKPGDPNQAAWTLLEDPDGTHELGDVIPGKPGQIKIVDDGGTKKCAGAAGIVLQMGPAARIAGIVADNQGNPIAEANVKITCRLADKNGMSVYPFVWLAGSEGPRDMVAKTDIDGRYVFTNVPRFWEKCSFSIAAYKDGYVIKDGASIRVDCPFESKQVDIEMFVAGISITGRVINNLGEPIVGYYVVAIVDDSGNGYSMMKTDEKGRFEMTGCPIVPNLKLRAKLLGSLQMGWKFNKLTKDREFVFYSDAVAEIDYQPGKTEYRDVEIVAEKPDITLNIELKNTAGEPVAYFPVVLESKEFDSVRIRRKLSARTDPNGKCTITEVPRVQELLLRLRGAGGIGIEKLTREQRRISAENDKYAWTTVPVELTPARKEYTIQVTLKTKEEFHNQ